LLAVVGVGECRLLSISFLCSFNQPFSLTKITDL
jgi:hypothetical protein